MIRLALFDIDGTLIRTGGAGVRAFERTCATEFHIENGTGHMKFAGRTDTSLVREFFTSHRLEPTQANFDRFFARYVFLLEHYLPQGKGGACRGVRTFIGALKALPQPPLIGLLTGNIRLGAEIKLRHYQLWEHFVLGAFGDDHEDRDQLARVARHRGSQWLGRSLAGPEVLVVGDTPHDIRCGRAIGARVLAVGTGGATRDQLVHHRPDWLVEDLSHLSAEAVCA
ncbi:MAG: hypothetical protein FJ387_23460 [Verrucomicrobia bacterium]|nr:hypothetical protein [Verrucomicrobiota bacterium]